MGVPGFFKRLCIKYPYITVDCKEEKAQEVNGVRIPVDSSQPNPNHVEFDNLYLDMNEITHLCCNPKNKPAPQEEQGKIREICLYIDRLFSIVRPRRLLYMAFDGVAPRAKMNLQRSRRFRAIKESRPQSEDAKRMRVDASSKPQKGNPGTEFMFHLFDHLRKYITDRLNSDPGWKGINVILSDAKTPGEGEHKIMDYIRKQRANPDHDPSTHHCLCGADTDLIMLGLATHEVNFTIIRPKSKPGGKAHEMDAIPETKFKFLRLELLKECLEKDLRKPGLSFTFDLERAIDDWVFMCFFVGNDFLPPLPSLDIREGAMERLMQLYKKTVKKTKGYMYLTDNGVVNLQHVQLLMTDLGKAVDEAFMKWRTTEEIKEEQAPATGGPTTRSVQRSRAGTSSRDSTTQHAADGFQRGKKRGSKRGRSERVDKDDTVRLGEDGWKERYYQNKFDSSVDEVRADLVRCYVEGLCWVLQYYYQGCASWKWYFPYHYAPFASDFLDIGKLSIKFDKGTPLKPLEQLMFVLPPASINFLPETWGRLIVNKDSPIFKFYPEDFKVDYDGKMYASQGVAILPFVDEKLLMETLEDVYPNLTAIEKKRNSNGPELLFVGKDNPLYDFIRNLYDKKELKEAEPDTDIDPSLTNGMRGKIGKDGEHCPYDLRSIPKSSALSVTFCAPTYPEDHIFEAKRLPGATLRKWRKSLLICGCLGLSDATDAIVVDVANSKLQIELSKEDIESSCRMSEARPRPIKVVLKSCRKREEIIQNCSKLRGSKIVIKDDDPLLN